MPMSELERKAAFKAACTMQRTTMEAASRDVMGVGVHHLNEGLAGRRTLSEAVQDRFSGFIGRGRADVFGLPTAAVA